MYYMYNHNNCVYIVTFKHVIILISFLKINLYFNSITFLDVYLKITILERTNIYNTTTVIWYNVFHVKSVFSYIIYYYLKFSIHASTSYISITIKILWVLGKTNLKM